MDGKTRPENSHIMVLTRFSYRSFVCLANNRYSDTSIDPLDEENLAFRFLLLDLLCRKSLAAQASQDFDWIIIVDPELPLAYREKLTSLADRRSRTYLCEYPEHADFYSLDWVRRFVPDRTEWLVTINLDDDDLLPVDYMTKVFALLHCHLHQAKKPLVYRMFGITDALLWDLHFSPWGPLGFLAPYHRASKFASCGLGMISKYPEMNYSVLGLEHSNPHWYGTGSKTPIKKFQAFSKEVDRLEHLGLLRKDELWRPDYLATLITSDPVLTTNHRRNVQWTRLLEYKPGMRLAMHSDLERYGLDLQQIQDHRDCLRLCLERQIRFFLWKPYQLGARLITYPLVLLRTLLAGWTSRE
jgi:Putative rhamnosyl transferase